MFLHKVLSTDYKFVSQIYTEKMIFLSSSLSSSRVVTNKTNNFCVLKILNQKNYIFFLNNSEKQNSQKRVYIKNNLYPK